jgi:hypothetical protein
MVDTIKDAVTNVVTDAVLNDAIGKKWYASKTLWVNVIAAASMLLQTRYGFFIDPIMQGLALSAINIVLRKITKEPIIL